MKKVIIILIIFLFGVPLRSKEEEFDIEFLTSYIIVGIDYCAIGYSSIVYLRSKGNAEAYRSSYTLSDYISELYSRLNMVYEEFKLKGKDEFLDSYMILGKDIYEAKGALYHDLKDICDKILLKHLKDISKMPIDKRNQYLAKTKEYYNNNGLVSYVHLLVKEYIEKF